MTKINFENLPSTNTPLSAQNLNQMQTNIETAINDVDTDVQTNTSAIGTLADLDTTEKSNLVEAINEVLVSSGATILYNNAIGDNGTITLSDSVENYSYIEIYYQNGPEDAILGELSVKIFDAANKKTTLFYHHISANSRACYISGRGITIGTTTIETNGGRAQQIDISQSGQVTTTAVNNIYIKRVVGYK